MASKKVKKGKKGGEGKKQMRAGAGRLRSGKTGGSKEKKPEKEGQSRGAEEVKKAGIRTRHQFIDYELSGGVARITLKKKPLNILDIPMLREMNRVLEDLVPSDEYKAFVIDAEGKAFSAGVDVADHTEDKIAQLLRTFHWTLRLISMIDEPTIALLHGDALGGGLELAMACDFVLASSAARLGLPEVKLGVFPPYACAALHRTVSDRKAREWILSGETFSAGEGKEAGLVNHVYSPGSFAARARSFVEKFTSLPGTTLRLSKRAILAGRDHQEVHDAVAAVEGIYLDTLMTKEDAREGIRAFLEKRKPRWTT